MRTSMPICLPIADPTALAGGLRAWSPGRREEHVDLERAADHRGFPGAPWCMSEVDIFCDLSAQEMDALGAAAPSRRYAPGTLVYTPHQPVETLFILKQGRIRIFRTSPDGRALTTAIIEPGTIFGEMVVVGQQMHDSYAEALDEVVVCVMSKADVKRLLLGDPRIAIRISETLGRRLGEIERRLSDTVFKSVPERIAATLATLADGATQSLGRGVQIRLTHEQLAALAATSRETTTKILGELSEQGLVSLSRGKINIVDAMRLREYGGD